VHQAVSLPLHIVYMKRALFRQLQFDDLLWSSATRSSGAVSVTRYLEDIGWVRFERSARARHINISVMPFTGTRIAVPYGQSLAAAETFAHQSRQWICKHQERAKRVERMKRALQQHAVPLNHAAAKSYLTERLRVLATDHGFTYHRVFIRQQKTLWGSCSPQHNISLNVKLMLLPEALREYVLLHELVHTRVHNHSKRFWTELGRYVHNVQSVDAQLDEWSLRVL
jgi:predicted metal-dependent hydrolase